MLRAGLAALGRSDVLKRAERALGASPPAPAKPRPPRCGARTAQRTCAWSSRGTSWPPPPRHVCPRPYSAIGLVSCAYGDPTPTARWPSARWRRAALAPVRGAPTTCDRDHHSAPCVTRGEMDGVVEVITEAAPARASAQDRGFGCLIAGFREGRADRGAQ